MIFRLGIIIVALVLLAWFLMTQGVLPPVFRDAGNKAPGLSEEQGRGLTVVTKSAEPAPQKQITLRAPGNAQERLALVIGNAAYGAAIGPLQNSVHDAEDMAATLHELGFTVTLLTNATLPQTQEAIATFSQQLRQSGTGLFYYAGHGVQINGVNYLIPLGARLVKAVDVEQQAVAAEQVLASMETTGNRLNIVIFDACRTNPFPLRWPSAKPGLAPMPAARGALIAYATAPGEVAADGTERNGTYTKHLLRTMTMPALLIEQVFKRVRVAVEEETQGRQIPWESSSLRGDFVFRPAEQAAPQATEAARSQRPEGTQTSESRAIAQPQQQPTIVGDDGTGMVLVPAGAFVMGSTAAEIEALLRQHPRAKRALVEDEQPQHEVFLEAFYIDRYEVINARFQEFVQATGYRTQAEREGGGKVKVGKTWVQVPNATWHAPRGQNSSIAGLSLHPVVQVSWYDAQAYCTWAGKRLPTEAEWEKAARGADGRIYPWGDTYAGDQVNFCDRHCAFPDSDDTVEDGYAETAPVGSYEAGHSPYGLYDMAGNVWEWVADRYAADYYQHSPARHPQGPATGSQVVLRGGSWLYPASAFRVATRAAVPPARRNNNIGFRCAKTP